MDFTEHTLSEAARLLRRQGVLYAWKPQPSKAVIFEEEKSILPANSVSNTPKSLQIPSHLQVLFHGKQPPIYSLWTYAQLDADLCATQPSPRLGLFRKIQASTYQHLGWSENQIAEWPLDQDLVLFEHGVSWLRPRFIICFGPFLELQAQCVKQKDLPYFSEACVYFLPALDPMLAGDQAAKNHAWKMLQSIPLY